MADEPSSKLHQIFEVKCWGFSQFEATRFRQRLAVVDM
jgi:hypothetical protein